MTGAAAAAPREARALLALIERAAVAAVEVIRAAEPRREALEWREKDVADFVTDVDVQAEARVVEVLRAAEPRALIVAEESAPGALPSGAPPAELAFIVDPLDGTTNFVHGFPEYAVSIAATRRGELTAGVVVNVASDEWFAATAGGGAWLGTARLGVSRVSDPARALIGTGFPFKARDDIPRYIAQLTRVMHGVAGVRRPGAAAIDLAHVAMGRFDAFWEIHLSPWDVAAGILLVREAGGVSTDFAGAPSAPAFGSIVAGNAPMHAWLLDTLRAASPLS